VRINTTIFDTNSKNWLITLVLIDLKIKGEYFNINIDIIEPFFAQIIAKEKGAVFRQSTHPPRLSLTHPL